MGAQMNWRRSDIISISTLFVVLGWVWFASAKVAKWDVVCDPKKGNDVLDTRVTVVETYLFDMKDDLKYIRHHMSQDREK